MKEMKRLVVILVVALAVGASLLYVQYGREGTLTENQRKAQKAVLERIENYPPFSCFKKSKPGRPVRVEMLEPFPKYEEWENVGDYYLVPLWENEKIKGVATVNVNTWESGGYARTTDKYPPKFPPFSLEEASKVAARNLENYDAQSLEKVGKLGWKLCEQTLEREFPLWVFEVGGKKYYVDWLGEFYEELTLGHLQVGG